MGTSLITLLRRTGLHKVPVEREPDRGRDLDDLAGDFETRERPAAGQPTGGGPKAPEDRD